MKQIYECSDSELLRDPEDRAIDEQDLAQVRDASWSQKIEIRFAAPSHLPLRASLNHKLQSLTCQHLAPRRHGQ